jgi:hypothetical protein
VASIEPTSSIWASAATPLHINEKARKAPRNRPREATGKRAAKPVASMMVNTGMPKNNEMT